MKIVASVKIADKNHEMVKNHDLTIGMLKSLHCFKILKSSSCVEPSTQRFCGRVLCRSEKFTEIVGTARSLINVWVSGSKKKFETFIILNI